MHEFTTTVTENDRISPFLKILSSDRLPNTPKLSLSIELQSLDGPTVAKEGSNNMLIYHIHRDPNDGHDEPCTIYWSGSFEAFGSKGFVLLRHTADGEMEKVEGLVESWNDEYLSSGAFWGSKQGFHELAPGQSIWFGTGLEESWIKALIPGERYELVWPGGEISWWGWGTIEQSLEKYPNPSAQAILPGPHHLSFDVVDRPKPPVYETPRPQWPTTPVPGTPKFRVTLSGGNQKKLTENFVMQYTITYIGITSEDPQGNFEPATRSIVFDADNLVPSEWAFRRHNDGHWNYCELNGVNCAIAGALWIDYEGPVEIAKSGRFISLAPGESWSDSVGGDLLPKDLVLGDEIRYQVDGCLLETWNWGSMEEHSQTVLFYHHGFKDPIWTERPIVLPASNPLEFSVVE
ncbi:uncharacterized protein N7511_003656 [Penicillium nucicola]|uniref:uncharacterized protein n=1 Tax=Penicillium nucicola TaxID=1850975 RepID=UPI002544FA8B|nr:uncharacterized protein N7511_003656 [Penicillium nucicola]KAJ5766040.1 hypothetical protein N7511_003656 [Penicillium nucicola]